MSGLSLKNPSKVSSPRSRSSSLGSESFLHDPSFADTSTPLDEMNTSKIFSKEDLEKLRQAQESLAGTTEDLGSVRSSPGSARSYMSKAKAGSGSAKSDGWEHVGKASPEEDWEVVDKSPAGGYRKSHRRRHSRGGSHKRSRRNKFSIRRKKSKTKAHRRRK